MRRLLCCLCLLLSVVLPNRPPCSGPLPLFPGAGGLPSTLRLPAVRLPIAGRGHLRQSPSALVAPAHYGDRLVAILPSFGTSHPLAYAAVWRHGACTRLVCLCSPCRCLSPLPPFSPKGNRLQQGTFVAFHLPVAQFPYPYPAQRHDGLSGQYRPAPPSYPAFRNSCQ